MSSVEPTSDVWEHGLLPLPGAKLSEASLLALLEHLAVRDRRGVDEDVVAPVVRRDEAKAAVGVPPQRGAGDGGQPLHHAAGDAQRAERRAQQRREHARKGQTRTRGDVLTARVRRGRREGVETLVS